MNKNTHQAALVEQARTTQTTEAGDSARVCVASGTKGAKQ